MARAYDESGIPASSPTYTCAADTVHRLRGAISFINNTLALQVRGMHTVVGSQSETR